MDPKVIAAFGKALAAQIKAAGPALGAASQGFGQGLAASIKASGAAAASVIQSLGNVLTGTIRSLAVLARGGTGGGSTSGGGAGGTQHFRDELNGCTQSLKRFGAALLGLALASTITGFNQFRQVVEYLTQSLSNALAPVLFSLTAGLLALADVVQNVVTSALKLLAADIITGMLGAIAAFVKGVQRFILWFSEMQERLSIVLGNYLRTQGMSKDQADKMEAASSKLRRFLDWNVAAEMQDFDQKLMDAAGAVAQGMRMDLSKNSGANVGFGNIADAWKRMQEQSFQSTIQAKQLAAQEKIVRMIEGAVNGMKGKELPVPAFMK